MSSCVVRQATAKDFKAVLDIGIVYGGRDYLPYFYHDFINDPDYMSYVCEVDGKIIGYQCALIHDDGRVIQARAGRVIPSHQGRGYSKAMGDRLRESIANNTTIQYMWFASSNDVINWADIHENPNKKHLHTLKVYKFIMPRPSTSYKLSKMMRLNKTQLGVIFDCSTLCHKLFPRGIIHVHYIALGLEKKNIRHIINDNTSVYVKVSQQRTLNEDEMTIKAVSTISVGLRYWSAAGQVCEISFYGEDLNDLEDHIQAHILDVPESESINVGLFLSQLFPQKILDDVYEKFAKRHGKYLGYYHLAVVENKLKEKPATSKY